QYEENYIFNASFKERRDVLEGAYQQCRPYLDQGFVRDVGKPGKFFDRLWELALCSILLHKGFVLEKSVPTKGARPDFCILQENKKIWVEAICPDLGNKDPVPPPPVLIPGVMHTETIDIASDLRPRAL